MANTTVYIAMGSNLGPRKEHLDQALAELARMGHGVLKKVSSYYETDPVGGPPGQGAYLNAAAELDWDGTAEQLLTVLLEVEQRLGRTRTVRFGPRILDLDLLLFGNVVLSRPDLILPHPRMHERLFVLEPLAEIAPQVIHPVLARSIEELRNGLRWQLSQGHPPGRELQELRAMVTGSTTGIGRAILLKLAGAGADVVVHGRRSAEAAESVAEEARLCGVRAQVVMADLCQVDDCRRLVESAWDAWKGLDIWINNAGADTLTGNASNWSFERKLQELWAVDVAATLHLSRAVGERMQHQGRGVIINMGWDKADTGMEGDSGQLFGVIKGAVMAFSKSLAVTLAPLVRVNCLAPGWIKTAWGEKASEMWQERVRRETPMQDWGTPEDVASAALWLASPAASYVTGQVIRINGGAVR